MTDETQEAPSKPAPSAFSALRKPLIAVVTLVVIWFLFGQLVPRSVFAPQDTSPVPIAPPMPQANEPAQPQIAELTQRVEQMEAKLKTFEDIIAATPQPVATTPGDSEVRIAELQAALEAKLAQLPQTSGADEERMTALEEKIQSLQLELEHAKTDAGKLHASATSALTVMSAYGQLKEAFLRGDPFSKPLLALQKLTAGQAHTGDLLAELAPAADKGATTVTGLQSNFAAALDGALSAARDTHSMLGNVSSLIRIRKVGENQKGNDDEAVLARAEAKISRGDIEGSLREIESLSPQAAPAFSAWADEARAALRMREALNELQLALTEPPAPQPETAPKSESE